MAGASTSPWAVLEQWRAKAFFFAAGMFIVAAILNVVAMIYGVERLSLMVGEAFIAVGWLGGVIGLLGLSSPLRDQSRWLVVAGVVFALIGAVTFAILALASLIAFFNGGGVGELPIPFIYLFPGIIVGSLLAFIPFGIGSLRSSSYSGTIGIFLLVPPSIFLVNFFVLPMIIGTGPNPPEIIFLVTSLLALVMLAIGYLLRTNELPAVDPGIATDLST